VQTIIAGRPDIIWLGPTAHTALPALYREADLMMSAKLRQNCPNAVLEAMASGLPVACFDSGAHHELIDNEAGICIPLADDYGPLPHLEGATLAEAGQAILQNHRQYASSARKRAEDCFDLNQMARKYREVFERVVARGRHAHRRMPTRE
jgi:glycosyltransferase involved in cell wall biosynthesis